MLSAKVIIWLTKRKEQCSSVFWQSQSSSVPIVMFIHTCLLAEFSLSSVVRIKLQLCWDSQVIKAFSVATYWRHSYP